MSNGKITCETLKKIRKEIADANGIPYTPVDCTHKRNCKGTCPACEAEMRYLERELTKRRGKRQLQIVGVVKESVADTYSNIARNAAAITMSAVIGCTAFAPVDATAQESAEVTVSDFMQMVRISGVVIDGFSTEDILLPFANVRISGTSILTSTDLDGEFSIDVPIGKSIEFSYPGFYSINLIIDKKNYKRLMAYQRLAIVLEPQPLDGLIVEKEKCSPWYKSVNLPKRIVNKIKSRRHVRRVREEEKEWVKIERKTTEEIWKKIKEKYIIVSGSPVSDIDIKLSSVVEE